MIEIVIGRPLAATYGKQIESAAQGRARIVAIRGGDASDPTITGSEIAVNGPFEGPASFKEIIGAMPALRWVHSTGAGIDDFASAELMKRGVHVTNSSGIYAPAMVEYVLAMLTSVLRHFPSWLDGQRRHEWIPIETYVGTELHGKQIGVIGYGKVGQQLAVACRALGMQVWACDIRVLPKETNEPLHRFLTMDELPELLATSDFIVVAVPLTSKTRGMFGATEFATMKRNAILVNIARGPIVDENALLAALRGGRLRAAILDVVGTEPLPRDSELWDAPHLLITPHISGGDTSEGWQRAIDLFCANLVLYLDGLKDKMTNVVDLRDHL
jgi:phosphoglycerate dehydrogenase-like enzyme